MSLGPAGSLVWSLAGRASFPSAQGMTTSTPCVYSLVLLPGSLAGSSARCLQLGLQCLALAPNARFLQPGAARGAIDPLTSVCTKCVSLQTHSCGPAGSLVGSSARHASFPGTQGMTTPTPCVYSMVLLPGSLASSSARCLQLGLQCLALPPNARLMQPGAAAKLAGWP
jgi:hypothetical protein